MPPVSSRIQTTLDPCVVLMKDLTARYADDWKSKGGIYSLAQGVVYWKPPPSCTTALQAALSHPDNELHCYGPDEGLDTLRNQLVQKIADVNGLRDHRVMITAGANQAYMNCVLTLLGGDDDDDDNNSSYAVVFAPYYFNHVMALQMVIGKDRVLIGPTNAAGEPDLEWLLQQQQQQGKTIRMVTVTNPGNPTGTTLSLHTCQALIDATRTLNAWMVWDCTYEDFVYTTSNATTASNMMMMIPAAPHSLHIFSFSKAYSLAGYRCGYVAVPQQQQDDDDDIIWNHMLKVQDTIPIATSRISQIAAEGALQAGKEWVQERIATLAESRETVRRTLESVAVTVMGGSGAMYFMAKLAQGQDVDDIAIAEALVRDYGVAVIPGSFCGAPGWIRVCYSNLHPEDCGIAAKRLGEGLEALLPKP